jgi:hypothetical protein
VIGLRAALSARAPLPPQGEGRVLGWQVLVRQRLLKGSYLAHTTLLTKAKAQQEAGTYGLDGDGVPWASPVEVREAGR